MIGLFKALLRGFRRSCKNTQANKLALEHLEDRTMPTGFALQLALTAPANVAPGTDIDYSLTLSKSHRLRRRQRNLDEHAAFHHFFRLANADE